MFAYALLLCSAISGQCLDGECRPDAVYGVNVTQQAAPQLPQDAYKPYLAVIGDKNDPQVMQLVEWFNVHPTLRGIKAQTHFSVIYTDSAMYARYRKYCPQTPCVWLQESSGKKIPQCCLAGDQIPLTADAMAVAMNGPAKQYFSKLRGKLKKDRESTPPQEDNSPSEDSPVVEFDVYDAEVETKQIDPVSIAIALLSGMFGSAGTTNTLLLVWFGLTALRAWRRARGKPAFLNDEQWAALKAQFEQLLGAKK